jgi:hypothetical protein
MAIRPCPPEVSEVAIYRTGSAGDRGRRCGFLQFLHAGTAGRRLVLDHPIDDHIAPYID